jgi:hypothetical protein
MVAKQGVSEGSQNYSIKLSDGGVLLDILHCFHENAGDFLTFAL